MSFQDLESGRALTSLAGPMRIEQGPSRALAAGVFRINTAVAGYKRLVNSVGTPRDTVDLRHNLRKTRLQIAQLVKDTSAELDHVRETDKFGEVDASKKIADAKLTKDYHSVLKEFEKAQLLAAEREKAFPRPSANNARLPVIFAQSFTMYHASFLNSSNKAGELEISTLNPMQASLLREANRQVMLMEDELVLNEAIIEEREQGIREIQREIGDVNEIFRDLAMLVSQQGAMIGEISSNIDSSHSATSGGANQIAKASNLQRSSSSMTCLMLVIVGITLLIVVFVFLS